MGKLFLHIGLYLSLLFYIIRPTITVTEGPRMIFTETESFILRRRLFNAPTVKTLIVGEDSVAVFGTAQISLIDFHNQQKSPVNMPVQWDECVKNACIYNITAVHKSQGANHIFVCGANRKETACCIMNISEHSAKCTNSDKVTSIKDSIRDFIMKEGEASAYVESPDSADLYITDSGSQDVIGIRRFGKYSVRPANHDEEQYYIKLVVSKQDRKNDALQDKIYGFYNEKNTDTDMYSVMWRPYVTQICMTDTGGPKNNMQSTWTSQLNARLFCGNMEQKQHFSELLDIATVEAGHWQDTRVYGLFQNEWGIRAVCVYTIQDIDHVFKNSPFKNSDMQPGRTRMCVADSTKLGFETLKQIKASREMQKSIQPGNSLGPILISYHHYSHITVHNFQDKRDNNHTILFLSLSSGAVHKVKLKRSGSEANPFIIAEYKPFNHRAHIVSMSLNPSTKKLYVTSKTEVAQIDVANCERYGDVCEECVLAGDPYCGWNEDHCVRNGPLQVTENMANCSISMSNKSPIKEDQIFVPRGSRFFFECPVSSLHAQYGWYHDHRTMTAGSCRASGHSSSAYCSSAACSLSRRAYTAVSLRSRATDGFWPSIS
uniref:Sema domain-containing protein n=2 Tax=Neogobius melanostomus TaxID=47308 RepID=A0A8C6WTX8_9GOBI